MHRIVIISIGPGGKDHITPEAMEKASECEVLIGSEAQLRLLPPREGQVAHRESHVERIFRLIEEHRGKRIGILVTGDAGIYSLSQKIIERFGKESVEEIVPGISSIQTTFARLKESWLDVKVLSLHGRSLEGLEGILHHKKVVLLCDQRHNARAILRHLLPYRTLNRGARIYVCQNLTLDDETIIEIKGEGDIKGIGLKEKELIVIIQEDA